MQYKRLVIQHPAGNHLSCLSIGNVEAGSKPLLVFSHATGFNAQTYTPLFEQLADVCDIVAPDARGHGLSTVPADPRKLSDWSTYYADIALVLNSWNRPAFLAGHSLGGMCSLIAAKKAPGMVRGVMAIDPVFLDPLQGSVMSALRLLNRHDRFPLAAGAKRRKAEFESIEQVKQVYKKRRAFAAWPDEWLDAYVEAAFESFDAGVRLRCHPLWESKTFSSVESWPWKRLPEKSLPVNLILAQRESTCSDWSRRLLKAVRPDWQQTVVPGSSHFLPMENTTELADQMKAFMAV